MPHVGLELVVEGDEEVAAGEADLLEFSQCELAVFVVVGLAAGV
jgi:hypothetical protein